MEIYNLFSITLSLFLTFFFAKSRPLSSPIGIKGAYWPSWQAQTLPPSSIPTAYFNHLFYAFVLVDETTFRITITQTDDQNMFEFTATLRAATPPAKSMLSIGGGAGAAPGTFSNMVRNVENRNSFIISSIDTARKYGFDGIDLDWEFPSDPREMENLALLFKEWRDAINQDSLTSGKTRLLLSSAVYFASNFFLDAVQRNYPGNAIKNYVDFVSPMCYDYHGSWDPLTTGAQALLYDEKSNVSTSYGISTWKKDDVPSNKIVMGMPVYGRTWQLKDPNINGIGAPAVGTGPGGGVMIYSDIVEFNEKNKATVVFDRATVSTYSYVGTSWIGYDDAVSIKYKVQFAKNQGLGGYFFWALGQDSNWSIAAAASKAWDEMN